MDPKKISGFHAHLYFDESQIETAKAIRAACQAEFTLDLGAINLNPVGPHPVMSTQLGFATVDFERMFYWLLANRQQLDVLIHPLTGDDYLDHTDGAVWLGRSYQLKLEGLQP